MSLASRNFFKRYGIGYVMVILALACFWFGMKNLSGAAEYQPEYGYTQALVTDKDALPGTPTVFLTLTYTTAEGTEYTGKHEFKEDAEIGDVIDVLYSLHNPKLVYRGTESDLTAQENEYIQQHRTYGIAELAAGVMLVILGDILIIRKIKKNKSETNSE